MAQKVELRFEGVDEVEAQRLARLLKDDLLDEVEGISAEISKDRADTMDFGATLVLVLGTRVAVEIAKAVGDFLRRHSGAKLNISADGAVIAQGLDSKDAAKIASAFAERFKAN